MLSMDDTNYSLHVRRTIIPSASHWTVINSTCILAKSSHFPLCIVYGRRWVSISLHCGRIFINGYSICVMLPCWARPKYAHKSTVISFLINYHHVGKRSRIQEKYVFFINVRLYRVASLINIPSRMAIIKFVVRFFSFSFAMTTLISIFSQIAYWGDYN